MGSHGLRDQDRLDGVSNFVIWRASILSVMDEYDTKNHSTIILAVPADLDPVKKFNENQAQAMRLIMDRVKDHVLPHIAGKNMTNEMWISLEAMYQGSSVQRMMVQRMT